MHAYSDEEREIMDAAQAKAILFLTDITAWNERMTNAAKVYASSRIAWQRGEIGGNDYLKACRAFIGCAYCKGTMTMETDLGTKPCAACS